jgi:uncharacterized protein YndB with AHSA1/START domain
VVADAIVLGPADLPAAATSLYWRRVARYDFVDVWQAPGPIEDVWALIATPQRWPEWWPTWREVAVSGGGQELAVGTRLDTVVKAALPYYLRITFEVTEVEPPRLVVTQSYGDLEGSNSWQLEADGPHSTRLTLRRSVLIRRPLLRLLSPVLRPLFAWNHDVAMRDGQRGLLRALEQSRGTSV